MTEDLQKFFTEIVGPQITRYPTAQQHLAIRGNEELEKYKW